MTIYALDTEDTGLDLHHGARPFLVTVCDDVGVNTWWEWDVNPKTREVEAVSGDLREINDMLASADQVVLQNAKFDYVGLRLLMDGKNGRPKLWWDWGKVRDTLLAGHLLASNQPHDLTSMALIYLKVNIQPLEDRLKQATVEARRICKTEHPDWRLAKRGLPEMPSAKDTVWKYDSWLPRLLARERGYSRKHPWFGVCSEYANGDSSVTLALYRKQMELLKERGLLRIYQERLKVLPIVVDMESYGVTISKLRMEELRTEFGAEAERCKRVCLNLADNEIEELPLSGVSNALKSVVYGKFKLESNKRTKKGNDSMDKSVLEHWLATLPRAAKPYRFIANLRNYRKRMTALNYLDSYERFWLPTSIGGWFRLHPSLNPTGTDTLRWSSQSPNEQNISKQEGFNLRYCFGPAPGREWWSLDAKNIELRIPAYESGEQELIELFEQPDDPPYYGSTHLLNFHTVYPDIWAKELREVGEEKVGPHCKKKYAATWYQWCKNGNFAVQYGAVDRADGTGTADRAFHRSGSHARLKTRFSKLEKLNAKWIDYAERTGYVETMPDRTVDPKRGYPLLCSRSQWGGILPTVPLNYHVQGTACWWMMKAMIRCQAKLNEWAAKGFKGYMVMQVHDELVFDFPRGAAPDTNLPQIRTIQKLMEQGGDDIGVPTPVGVEYHAETWSEGASV